MKIEKIVIEKKLVDYLENRNLGKQYQKAKQYILLGKFKNVDLST